MKKYYLMMILVLACLMVNAQDDKKPKADSVKKEKPKKKTDLPLEAARSVNIKTTEGIWMSMDGSPDGKTIAFDFMGDIFTMPMRLRTGGAHVWERPS